MKNSQKRLSGAAKKTRTSTGFRPQRPQRCASTNSAMAARASTGRRGPLAKPVGRRNRLYRFRKGEGNVANRHRMKLGRRLAVFPGNGAANYLHQLLPVLVNGSFIIGMICTAVLLAAVAAAPAVVAQSMAKQGRQISVREDGRRDIGASFRCWAISGAV